MHDTEHILGKNESFNSASILVSFDDNRADQRYINHVRAGLATPAIVSVAGGS